MEGPGPLLLTVADEDDEQLSKLKALKLTTTDPKFGTDTTGLEPSKEAILQDSKSVPSPSSAEPAAGTSGSAVTRFEKPKATLDEQLAAAGLGRTQLTQDGREKLRLIASVSEKLGLLTTDKEAVLAAVSELRKQQWNAEDTKANITKLAAKVKGQVETIRKRSEELDRLAQTVREKQTVQLEAGQDKEQRKLRADVKGQNYAEELEQLELKLARTGFVPKLSHDALVERSAKLEERQAEVEALGNRLSFYADLPPALEAATQVFATRQQQLQAANKQFEEGLAQL